MRSHHRIESIKQGANRPAVNNSVEKHATRADLMSSWSQRSISIGAVSSKMEREADATADAVHLSRHADPIQATSHVMGHAQVSPRLHNDTQSHQAATALNARAFTLGHDIYFGLGQYQPHTNEGRHLISHEVAHTLQPGAESTIRREPLPGMENAPVDIDGLSFLMENPGSAGDFSIGDPLLEAFRVALAGATRPRLRNKLKKLLPQLYAMRNILSATSSNSLAPGDIGLPESYQPLKIDRKRMGALKNVFAALQPGMTLEARIANLVSARKSLDGAFKELAVMAAQQDSAASPGIQSLNAIVQSSVKAPLDSTIQGLQIARDTVRLNYGAIAGGLVPQSVTVSPALTAEPEADVMARRMLRYRQVAPEAMKKIKTILGALDKQAQFDRAGLNALKAGIDRLVTAFRALPTDLSTPAFARADEAVKGLGEWSIRLAAAMDAAEILQNWRGAVKDEGSAEVLAVLEQSAPKMVGIGMPPRLVNVAEFARKTQASSSPQVLNAVEELAGATDAAKSWIREIQKAAVGGVALVNAQGEHSAWETEPARPIWQPKGVKDAGGFVGEDTTKVQTLLQGGGLQAILRTQNATFEKGKHPIPKIPSEVWAAVLGHISNAIRLARSGASSSDAVAAAVELVVAADPESAAYRDEIKAAFESLVNHWKTPLSPTVRDRHRAELNEASLPNSNSKALAAQILEGANSWPFGTEDFFQQVRNGFGGESPFTHYGSLVQCKFFGHTLTVDARLVAYLEKAESFYVAEAKQRGIPSDNYTRVNPESGSHNFRAGRSGEQAKMLLGSWSAHNTHMMGWAVDINYGSNADPKNLRITNPETWKVLRSVLKFAGREDLASLRFGENWDKAQAPLRWLEISKVFKENYVPWKAFMVQKVQGNTTANTPPSWLQIPWLGNWKFPAQPAASPAQLPSAKSYSDLLKSRGIDLQSKESQALLRSDQQNQTKYDWAKQNLGRKLDRTGEVLLKFTDLLDSSAAVPPQVKRSQVLKPLWQELVGKAMLDKDESQILNLAAKVLAAIERLLSVHAVVGESGRKFPEADLVKRRDAIQNLVAKLSLASTTRKSLEANPQFATIVQSNEDLAVLKAHASTQSFLQSWLKHGLVDHELLFLESMGKAGFTWGGIWPTPDFHHFEKTF